MPRKDQGWITFQTSEEERQLLEEICQMSQRTKTEVLRELLRGLRYATPAHTEPSEPIKLNQDKSPEPSLEKSTANPPQVSSPADVPHPPRPFKVSSRNVLKGRIKQITKGSVNTEVTLEILHPVELTSIITTTSAEALELAKGKDAYAVIKSNDVVIAME